MPRTAPLQPPWIPLSTRIADRGRALVATCDRGADAFALRFPPVLERTLTAALWHVAAHHPERGVLLERHYLETMPGLLVDGLFGSDLAARLVFDTPLDWPRMPTLRAAVAAIYRRLADVGADPARRMPAPSQAALEARFPTLGALYAATQFGRAMPLLGAYPHELARMAARVHRGETHAEVVERCLGAQVIHELWHLDETRPPCPVPFLDECLVAGLGAEIMPSVAWGRGTLEPIYGSWLFVQVADALRFAFGDAEVVAAHIAVGADGPFDHASWCRVVGQDALDRIARVGWSELVAADNVHLMGDIARPLSWARFLFALHADAPAESLDAADQLDVRALARALPERSRARERQVVERALATVSIRETLGAGSCDSRLARPPAPVVLDFASGHVRLDHTGPLADGLTAPVHWLPPALCARWLARGVAVRALNPGAAWLDELPAHAAAIVDA